MNQTMVTIEPLRTKTKSELKPLGLVWIKCSCTTTLSFGLEHVLQGEGFIHQGQEPPSEGPPSSVIVCVDKEDIASEVKYLRALLPNIPTLVFDSHNDSDLAKSALKAGAYSFIHAQMQPGQIIGALLLASEGMAVVPGRLVEEMVNEKPLGELSALTRRQLEVLKLVAEGLSNACIARQLSLSESTIKEHLRAAYKTLGIQNRVQAVRLFRRNYPSGTASETAGGVQPG